jgi:hypothetical protein
VLYSRPLRRLLTGARRVRDAFSAKAVVGLIGLSAAIGSAADSGHYSPVGGIEVFYGVIPSQVILGHPVEHAERKMHGGVPVGADQYHLIVSLFDGRTQDRIVDADVSARISAVGLHTQQKKLESMEFAGAVTYGNYFRMPRRGPYRIELDIRRPGAPRQASAIFEYTHPRRMQ